MTVRSRREFVRFGQPFRLDGVDREIPAGSYEVVTDEEMIEGLSFPVFRRVATMMMIPSAGPPHSVEMISINPTQLAIVQQGDATISDE